MSRVKKIIATLLVTALMVPSVAVAAATPSVTRTKLDASNVTVEVKPVTYTGAPQSVKVNVIVEGKTLVEGVDYILATPSVTKPGSYQLSVKIVGLGHYEGVVTKTVDFKVNKKAQKIKGKKKRKVKASKLKKKAVKVKLKLKSTGKGKLLYKVKSKKLKLNRKKGIVKIKKGTKKGTYIIKVRAKATATYKGTKWKRIKIKVK